MNQNHMSSIYILPETLLSPSLLLMIIDIYTPPGCFVLHLVVAIMLEVKIFKNIACLHLILQKN